MSDDYRTRSSAWTGFAPRTVAERWPEWCAIEVPRMHNWLSRLLTWLAGH